MSKNSEGREMNTLVGRQEAGELEKNVVPKIPNQLRPSTNARVIFYFASKLCGRVRCNTFASGPFHLPITPKHKSWWRIENFQVCLVKGFDDPSFPHGWGFTRQYCVVGAWELLDLSCLSSGWQMRVCKVVR